MSVTRKVDKQKYKLVAKTNNQSKHFISRTHAIKNNICSSRKKSMGLLVHFG